MVKLQIAWLRCDHSSVWTDTDTVELVWTGVVSTYDENNFHSRILGPTPSVIRGARVLDQGFS